MDMTWLSTLVASVLAMFGGLLGSVVPQADAPSAVLATTSVSSQVETSGQESITEAVPSASSLPGGSAWKTVLPLGDGKYTTAGAKKGYVYICNRAPDGGGAQVNGSWIHGTTWTPSEKIRVQGAVEWPNASYHMTLSGTKRTITTNDLPTDHTTGTYPIQKTDPAYQIDRNPSGITAQNYSFSLPAYPTADTSANCIYGMVGVMNNGVLLFDAFDAEYRDAVAHEVQDSYDGHPNQSGYHKHGFISAIKTMKVSDVVGFAFDGYPITGPLLPNGNYLATADLDACHGIESDIVLDGKTQKIYHYVLTQDFPYSVSCFKGRSYEPRPGGGGGGAPSTQQSGTSATSAQQGAGMTPPQEALTACVGKSTGSSCSFSTPRGAVTGTCKTPPNSSLACVPG